MDDDSELRGFGSDVENEMKCEILAFEGESESGRSRFQNSLDDSNYCDGSAEQAMHRTASEELPLPTRISEGNDSVSG